MSAVRPVGMATTEEQRAIRDSIGRWAQRADPVATVRAEEPFGWRTHWSDLAELGVFGVAVDERRGGAGGSLVDLAVMLEALAAALVPGPVLATAATTAVLDRAARAVPTGLLDGTTPCAVAPIGSPGLERHADGTVSGTLPAVTGYTPGAALLIPVDGAWALVAGAGITSAPVETIDHGTGAATVTLLNTVVAEGDLPADLVEQILVTLAAAQAAGTAGWAVAAAAAHAAVREQFGVPIGSFQAIKHLCSWMLCRAEQASVVAWDAAVAMDQGQSDDSAEVELAVAAAGALAPDAAVAAAQDCIQVHGGIGFTWEHDTHLHLRRALVLRADLGGSARWRARAATVAGAGVRRRLTLDLGDAERHRPAIAAEVDRIAALDVDRRRTAMADAGLIAPHWPRPYGLGADAALQVLADQECVRAGLDRPDLVIGWWAIPPILQAGTPEQIERFVPGTLRGEITWCQLFSEPGAGSDLASLSTRARRVVGGYRLTGQKVWNSFANVADYGICLARTDQDAPKHRGITYFVVDMNAPGFDVRPLREITGASLFNEVFIDDVFVPDDQVIGEVDGGWPLARLTLANERVQMSGGTKKLGQEMEELLRRVGDGVLKDAMAEVGTLVAQAQSVALLQHKAVLGRIGGADPGPESAVQKLVGVRNRQRSAEFLAERFPGEAAREGTISRMLLLTRQLSIAGGSEQILLTLAAERILGLPR